MTSSSTEVVPYFGRSAIICGGGDECKNALKDLLRVAGEISSLAQNNDEWKQLKETVCNIANQLIDENYKVDAYKLNILRTSVLPYISLMKTRVTLSRQRFHQTQHLLRLLSETECESGKVHPGFTLLAIEDVIRSISREQSWWKSEFSTKLNQSVNEEWRPILRDNKRAIQSICGKLALIGLMEIVRPILLIWPMWLLISEVLVMVKGINEKKGLTPHSVMQLCKTALLAAILYLLVSVMALMPGVGYSCLGVAGLGAVVSSSDPLLKQVCPYIAPNLAAMNEFINLIGSGSARGLSPEKMIHVLFPQVLSGHNMSSTDGGGGGDDVPSQHKRSIPKPQPECRVEELDDIDNVIDSDNTSYNTSSSSGSMGLRKRK
jgi:hypothetical protein